MSETDSHERTARVAPSATNGLSQQNATLLFADIVGYSRLMGRDQAQTIDLLEDYRQLFIEHINKQDGTVVEFIGDAIFARFDHPNAAVRAAIDIQKALFAYNHFRKKHQPKLQTRIGLHCGTVASKDGALFGDTVNIAARLEPLAYPGGICVSGAVWHAVRHHIDEPRLKLGAFALKNIQKKVRVYLIRPAGITLSTRWHYYNRSINQKWGAYRYPIAASVVAVLVASWILIPRWLVPGYNANYVEVSEFATLMDQSNEWAYLGGGITEALRSQLADMQEVYVLESGEGVEAPVILKGSVQRLGNNLRIAYQLIRRQGDVQIAGGKLDGTFKEIFILQDRVVSEIARYLADEFKLDSFAPARVNLTDDVTAYDFYMRGLDYLTRPMSNENSDQAIKFFTTALVHDPSFAQAEAGLCQAYWKKYLKSDALNWLSSAQEHCQAALAIQPTLPEAIEPMGTIYAELGEYQRGIEMLTDVLERDEKNMQAAASLADIYGRTNELDKAKTVLRKAIDKQPKNWEGLHVLGWLHLTNGEFDSAIDVYRRVLELTPRNSTAFNNLGAAFFYLGEFDKAANYYRKATDIAPLAWSYSNTGTMYYYAGSSPKPPICSAKVWTSLPRARSTTPTSATLCARSTANARRPGATTKRPFNWPSKPWR